MIRARAFSASTRSISFAGTAMSAAQSDDGATYDCTSDTTVTITLPQDVANAMQCTFTQEGAGTLQFVASGNADIASLLDTVDASHRFTAGQYAAVTVRMVSNSDGSHAEWRLYGATASE